MGAHAVFQGGWNKIRGGSQVKTQFAKDGEFAATVTVDFETRKVTTVVGDRTVQWTLPPGMKQIRFYGYYVKNTSSTFRVIELERD